MSAPIWGNSKTNVVSKHKTMFNSPMPGDLHFDDSYNPIADMANKVDWNRSVGKWLFVCDSLQYKMDIKEIYNRFKNSQSGLTFQHCIQQNNLHAIRLIGTKVFFLSDTIDQSNFQFPLVSQLLLTFA